jgi:phosphoglycolate phosphatase-like HAD superfamily hydrolase
VENAWILGDNYTDLDSAQNANIKGVFATWGYGQVKNSSFDAKVDSFEEFVELMLK